MTSLRALLLTNLRRPGRRSCPGLRLSSQKRPASSLPVLAAVQLTRPPRQILACFQILLDQVDSGKRLEHVKVVAQLVWTACDQQTLGVSQSDRYIYISIQRFPDGCSQGGGFKVLKITIQNSTAGRELNLNSKITRKAVSVE